MQVAQEGCPAEPPLTEPDPDIDQHACRSDDQSQDGIVPEFLAHGSAEQFLSHYILVRGAEFFVDAVDDLGPVNVLQRLGGTDHDTGIVSSGVDDLRIQVILADGLLHIRDLDLFVHVHLDHGAAGEVDTEVEAPDDTAAQTDDQDHRGNAVEHLSLIDKVDPLVECEAGSAILLHAEEGQLGEGSALGEQSHVQLCDDDCREDTDDDTDHEGERESLNGTCAHFIQDDSRDQGGHLRVDDGCQRPLITGLCRHPDTSSGRKFLPDTGEYDNVGVYRHTDSNDDTCDTGQGQCNAHQRHDVQYDDHVEQERQVRRDAKASVGDQHQEQDQSKTDQAGIDTHLKGIVSDLRRLYRGADLSQGDGQ